MGYLETPSNDIYLACFVIPRYACPRVRLMHDPIA